jgi:hypothetical protein
MQSILIYLNEHDYEKQLSDLWKEKGNQTRNLLGMKKTPEVKYKPAPKATPESEARRGAFDTDPEQFKKRLEEPTSEEAAAELKKKQEEWEPSSLTNNIVTKHPLVTGALGVGAYLAYKKYKKKDQQEKEKMDKIDPKFKFEGIKKDKK